MKSTEFITEIEKLSPRDYTGDKDDVGKLSGGVRLNPLPGNDRFKWGQEYLGMYTIIYIVDSAPTDDSAYVPPRKYKWEGPDEYKKRVALDKKDWDLAPRLVGRLTLHKAGSVSKAALQVSTIAVDKAYRGMGIAKSLYGIVLSILKRPLVSGDSQTPGGQRNWLSLASIPGVEMKGVVEIPDDLLGPKKPLAKRADDWDKESFKHQQKNADATIDQLMQLGGQYLGKSPLGHHLFAFDVVPGTTHLEPAIQTKINKLYTGGNENTPNLLLATWTGK